MTPTPPLPPFSQPKVRSLVAIFLVFTILLAIALAGLQAVTGLDLEDPLWVMLLYIVLFVGLSLWLRQSLQRYGVHLPWLIGTLPDRPRWLALAGLVLATLVFSLSSFVVSATLIAGVAPEFVENLLREIAAEANPRTVNPLLYQVVSAIATIIVAPITEEFLFRGFILQRWAVKWNLPLAVMLSSVLFGFMHLNPVGLTMFGLVMATLYIKTRSLLIPIAAHALNNLLATLMTYLPQETTPTTLDTLRNFLPVGMLLLAVSAPILVIFISKSWPRRDAAIPYVINAEKAVTDA